MIHMTICIRSWQKKRHVLLTDPSNADKISQPESNVVGDLDISRERYQYHKRDLWRVVVLLEDMRRRRRRGGALQSEPYSHSHAGGLYQAVRQPIIALFKPLSDRDPVFIKDVLLP